MSTLKVREATPFQLDFLVAKAQGRKGIEAHPPMRRGDRGFVRIKFNTEPKAASARFDPSTSWEYGGPIIEQERIDAIRRRDIYFPQGNENGDYYESWWDAWRYDEEGGVVHSMYGTTKLIAAMRCYVVSKLGDTVEIPDFITLGGYDD